MLFARFTSFAITCAVGLSIGVLQSLLYYASTQSWFPTDKGAALPGISALLTFIIIVIALYVRGSSLPTRGELIEQRLPAVPRPERLGSVRGPRAAVGVVALDRAALRLPQRADHLAGGDDHLPVLRGHHRVHRPGVAHAGRAGRRLGLRRVAPLQGRRHRLPAGAPSPASWRATVLGFVAGASALRVRGVSLAVVTLAAAVAIEQFGFANSTWGAGATGSPVPELKLVGIDLGTRASFRGLDGDVPSPILGFVVLAAVIVLGPAGGQPAPQRPGPADARRALQRARRGGRRHQRAQHEVRRLRDLVVHRRASAGRSTATRWARSAPSASGSSSRSGFVAFAYVGGITMVSGAVFGGLIATSGVIPHIFEAELGISGTWTLLVAGVTLILNLILFPDGVAGLALPEEEAEAGGGPTPVRRRTPAGSARRWRGRRASDDRGPHGRRASR